jgi:hypothetical protein
VLPVSIIVGQPGNSDQHRRPWIQGIVAGARFASEDVHCERIRSGPEGDLYMWTGFTLRLRVSQANDYAYNINNEQPRIYVIADLDGSSGLRPLKATVSLDEAQNLDATELRDAGQQVLPVAMPPEVYRWVEHFVLDHYQPRQRKVRGKRRSRLEYDAEVGDFVGDAG